MNTNGLEFKTGCLCAGSGCSGHLVPLGEMVFTPVGYQGAAQHTYTPACAGFHEPGPCPPSVQSYTVEMPR